MTTPRGFAPGWATPYLLTPYRAGGELPAGWDCWGLVRYVGRVHAGWRLAETPSPWGAPGPSERAARFSAAALTPAWREMEGEPVPTSPAVVLFTPPIHVGFTGGDGSVLHCNAAHATRFDYLSDIPSALRFFQPAEVTA